MKKKPSRKHPAANRGCAGSAGSALFESLMREAEADEDRGQLMRKVWSPTPWMIDIPDGDLEREIRHWLNEHIGYESSPIHGREGKWHRGGVTLFGWTWYGFATEDLMALFAAKWGKQNTIVSQPGGERKPTATAPESVAR